MANEASSDSTANTFETSLLENPGELRRYLAEKIDDFERILQDDRDFCNKDIEATYASAKKHVDTIVQSFHNRLKELKTELEEISVEHDKICDENKKQFDEESMEISNLYTKSNYSEAWVKYKDFESRFGQRPTMIQHVPKLHMHELDVNRYLSFGQTSIPAKNSQLISSAITTAPVLSNDHNHDPFLLDDTEQSYKEQIRNQKVIATEKINRDDGLVDENGHAGYDDMTEYEIDKSRFGIRSRHVENQQTTISNRVPSAVSSIASTTAPRRGISTRLPASSAVNHQSFSRRDNINSSPLGQVRSHTSMEEIRPTPTPPHSVCSSTQLSSPTVKSMKVDATDLKLVAHFQYERNSSLLMACSKTMITIFKTQSGRMDKWLLGVIERGLEQEFQLDWHDGLILSMGYIERNRIYMFTERDFIVYSLDKRGKMNSRHLPRGNDDDPDSAVSLYDGPNRGIGTVFGQHVFHIYQNPKSHWTLSKSLLDGHIHLFDYDLTIKLPQVQRFLHICVNEVAISFLVQTNESTYAVVFCSIKDCTPLKPISSIDLVRADRPLTICSAFIDSLQRHIWFVNDPTGVLIHCLNSERYLTSIALVAHAIGYVPENKEILIVSNKWIRSMNVNEWQFV